MDGMLRSKVRLIELPAATKSSKTPDVEFMFIEKDDDETI
jgi:hypothetical protein